MNDEGSHIIDFSMDLIFQVAFCRLVPTVAVRDLAKARLRSFCRLLLLFGYFENSLCRHSMFSMFLMFMSFGFSVFDHSLN